MITAVLLQSIKQEASAASARATEDLAKLAQSNDDLQNQLSELRSKLKERVAECGTLSDELRSAQDKLRETSAAAETAAEEAAVAAEAKIDALQKNLDELQSAEVETQQRCAALEASLQETQRELESERNSAARAAARSAEQISQLQESQSEAVTRMQEKLKAHQAKVSMLNDEQAMLEEEHEQSIADLKSKHKEAMTAAAAAHAAKLEEVQEAASAAATAAAEKYSNLQSQLDKLNETARAAAGAAGEAAKAAAAEKRLVEEEKAAVEADLANLQRKYDEEVKLREQEAERAADALAAANSRVAEVESDAKKAEERAAAALAEAEEQSAKAAAEAHEVITSLRENAESERKAVEEMKVQFAVEKSEAINDAVVKARDEASKEKAEALDRLRAENLSAAEAIKTKHDAAVADLKAQLADERSVIEQLREDMDRETKSKSDAEQEARLSAAQVAQLSADLEQCRASAAEAAQAAKLASEEAESLAKRQRVDMEARCSQLSQEKLKVEEDLAATKTELQTCKDDLQSLQDQHKSFVEEATTAKNTAHALMQTKLAEIETLTKNTDAAAVESQTRIDQLQNDLAASKLETSKALEKLDAERQSYEAKLTQLSAAHSKKLSEVRKEEQDAATTTAERLRSQHKEERQRLVDEHESVLRSQQLAADEAKNAADKERERLEQACSALEKDKVDMQTVRYASAPPNQVWMGSDPRILCRPMMQRWCPKSNSWMRVTQHRRSKQLQIWKLNTRNKLRSWRRSCKAQSMP